MNPQEYLAFVANLRKLDDSLVAWIAKTPANTDAEVQQVLKVMTSHGHLLQIINQLLLGAYQGAVAALDQPTKDLAEVTKRIKAVTSNIATAQEVISIASTAVAIAVQIAAMV